MTPRILTLRVRKEYFDQIKSGKKNEEYRRTIPYWRKRIDGKVFDFVEIVLGYPKAEDTEKRIRFPWKGYSIKTLWLHPAFDIPSPVVYAIRLEREIRK